MQLLPTPHITTRFFRTRLFFSAVCSNFRCMRETPVFLGLATTLLYGPCDPGSGFDHHFSSTNWTRLVHVAFKWRDPFPSARSGFLRAETMLFRIAVETATSQQTWAKKRAIKTCGHPLKNITEIDMLRYDENHRFVPQRSRDTDKRRATRGHVTQNQVSKKHDSVRNRFLLVTSCSKYQLI